MIKLGIVMDPISSINIKKDTSFAILLKAQLCGYEIFYMEVSDLFLQNGIAYAYTRILKVEYNEKKWYEFSNQQEIKLTELDVILMRKDPPFNTEFIYATYLLERAEEQGVLIINKPQSLRDCNEKIYISWFADLTPETLVTRNKEKICFFWKKHSDIILKPLDGMGGSSIFRIKKNDPNFNVITDILTNNGKYFCMVQKYLPEIEQGDKRIIVIDGQPIPYCLTRIPQDGETRANLAVGGYGVVRPLKESDWKIAHRLGPVLKNKGLIFVGLDIIGDKLTEINVTSPTGICEIELSSTISITSMLINAIEKRLS